MNALSVPLRKCRKCGLEALNSIDLHKFSKDSNCPHGRSNICLRCKSKEVIQRQRKNPIKHRYRLMMSRCYNPNIPNFHNYGGRGITVCEEWLNNRDSFVKWAKTNGFKPELQIDRIDNDEGYSPDNCRWVDQKTQLLNKRNTTTNIEKMTRICSYCRIEKPITEFHRDATSLLGRRYDCKLCHNERDNEYKRKRKLFQQNQSLLSSNGS